MATINEQIVIGRKFRKLIDESAKLWQRISFWTKASDVEFNDGMTAETKLGAIDGITDSLVSTSSRIAASAKALNTLNNNLMSHPQFICDDTGKITGYKTKVGADTVFPFNCGDFEIKIKLKLVQNTTTYNGTITITYEGGSLSYTASKGAKHVIGISKSISSTWLEMNVHIVDVTITLL